MMAEEKKPNYVLAAEHEKVCAERDRALAAAEAARQYEREAPQQRDAAVNERPRRQRQFGATRSVVSAPGGLFPTIVCLCGSTRFGAAFAAANLRETLAGKIVLSVGCFTHGDDELFAALSLEEQAATKRRLDALHLRKIDLSDEILVISIDGYLGESTRREITYALAQGKPVRWLEESARENWDALTTRGQAEVSLPDSGPGGA